MRGEGNGGRMEVSKSGWVEVERPEGIGLLMCVF